jgi:hypothetical protein
MSLLRSDAERRGAVVVRRVDCCMRIAQQTDAQCMPFLRGDEQRARRAMVIAIRRRPRVKQHLHALRMAHLARDEEGSCSAAKCFVGRYSRTEEKPQAVYAPLLCCNEERRGAWSVLQLCIRVRRKQMT